MHQFVRIRAPLAVNGKLQAAQICFIPDVGDLPDLVGFDQLNDLIHDGFDGGGIGNLGDLDAVGVLVIAVLCPEPDGASAGLVDLVQLSFLVEHVGAAGKVRPL